MVFIDETAVSTAMTRAYGRAKRGQRCVAGGPRGHWRATTLVSAVRSAGMTAPMVGDGAINGAFFRAYIDRFLANTLAPGDVVTMDNLAAHKTNALCDAIKTAGAYVLFLPSYSPDLNLIEMAFATLKTGLRNAAARTREGLEQCIAQGLSAIQPHECRNMFANEQYVVVLLDGDRQVSHRMAGDGQALDALVARALIPRLRQSGERSCAFSGHSAAADLSNASPR